MQSEGTCFTLSNKEYPTSSNEFIVDNDEGGEQDAMSVLLGGEVFK